MAPKPVKKRLGKVSKVAEIQSKVNAAVGKPVLKRGSDKYFIPVKIPSGSLAIDRITGGGFTLGRHVELYGDYDSGKSTIMMMVIALAQRRGRICALVDPEKVFDPIYFKHLGGIPEELLLFQPEKEWNAEDAVIVMMWLADLVDEEEIEVVGIDSVASLVTQEEMAKDVRDGDDRTASQARMMSRALRRITTVNRKTLFIWTNQEYMNIGRGAMFRPKETKGGRALGYYATTRIEFRKSGAIKEKGSVASKEGSIKNVDLKIGNWIQVRAEKHKASRPYMQAAFTINAKRGRIEIGSEIIHLGLEDGILQRVGSSIIYEDIDGETWKKTPRLFLRLLRENDELREELIEAIQDQTVQLAAVGEYEDEE